MKPIALVFSAAIALAPATAIVQAQERLNDTQLIETLNVLDQSKSIDVAALRRQAVDSVAANRGPDASLREPLSQELDNLSQFTVEIQFRTGSAVIRPASFRTVGVIADSLLHPTLREYKFLIVGHTDAVGDRKSNLTLSQKRADAVATRWSPHSASPPPGLSQSASAKGSCRTGRTRTPRPTGASRS